MAWTDPNTYIAGAILTAAQLNAMQANALAGGPIYATEAARTTAIPSPFEGQRAYITGSTVATATGAITAIPTGIQTIYNGAAWVCVTPVGASSQTSGTSTATAAGTTTLTGDAVAISATLATGTTALVTISANDTGSITMQGIVAFAVSGATTVAATIAATGASGTINGAYSTTLTRSFVIAGLTAGTNTFTLNYWSGSAGTSTWQARQITVQGIA
jgi:hypothetical protein